MMRCKLLVTDYSSVCWDVYYMGKPISDDLSSERELIERFIAESK